MKIVFMGTSQFAVPSLQRLLDSKHEVVGVVTQPDRPKGRGRKLLPSPVKELVDYKALEIYQPEKVRSEDAIDRIRAWEADLIVVASYGQIIPVEILDYPRFGCINVHASLLPQYRGAAPIQRAIMAGDKTTGITIMFMDEGLDTGDIIMQIPVEISGEMDHGQLEAILAEKGSDLLIDCIAVLDSGSMPRRKQDQAKTSYARRITRAEERINWELSALQIVNQIRAFSPVPGAYTSCNGKMFKVYLAVVVDEEKQGIPAQIVDITEKGFVVQTGLGKIEIQEAQREGKRRMNAREFLQGFRLCAGDRLI